MGDHSDNISTKIKRNIGVIKRIRNSLPKEYLEMLYETIVEPQFRYCNTVWDTVVTHYSSFTKQSREGHFLPKI